MALQSQIIETRQEGARYLTKIEVTDDITGQVYNRRFQSKVLPDQTRLDSLVNLAIANIQDILDMDANVMNLPIDEDRLLEYYRNIKLDIIRRIRAFPGATVQQAKDYVTIKYPKSPFDFDELYAVWIGIIGASTWAEFKTWVIDHKFAEID